MTTSEITWLLTGVSAGVIVTVFVYLVAFYVHAYRDLRAAEESLAQVRKFAATGDWYLALAARNVP
ncbi:hypothetical protein [Streptomyces antarcticus]|uniref:hypothetical protein n=1 Tax=Streptomyces antarcticus TaxID=2996458 RepID=UPI00226F845E|nr:MULTISPECIES: hypothetical protein [unclassified Streptomyces]MCY0943563.1 hypothetical protein [Streptomyces sp. H34-AA3]MCZ4083528.1 hypothetical protein [Streptomyces sp. H34-S5]